MLVNTSMVHLGTNKINCFALEICMSKSTLLSNQGNIKLFAQRWHFNYLNHTCQCGFRVMNNE